MDAVLRHPVAALRSGVKRVAGALSAGLERALNTSDSVRGVFLRVKRRFERWRHPPAADRAVALLAQAFRMTDDAARAWLTSDAPLQTTAILQFLKAAKDMHPFPTTDPGAFSLIALRFQSRGARMNAQQLMDYDERVHKAVRMTMDRKEGHEPWSTLGAFVLAACLEVDSVDSVGKTGLYSVASWRDGPLCRDAVQRASQRTLNAGNPLRVAVEGANITFTRAMVERADDDGGGVVIDSDLTCNHRWFPDETRQINNLLNAKRAWRVRYAANIGPVLSEALSFSRHFDGLVGLIRAYVLVEGQLPTAAAEMEQNEPAAKRARVS